MGAYPNALASYVILVLIVVLVLSSVVVIRQGYAGVILRLGKFKSQLAPGLHFKVPLLDTVQVVSLMDITTEMEPSPVVTKDNVSLNIDAFTVHRVTDPRRSLFEIQNVKLAISNISASAMRNIIGQMTLADVLAEREQINSRLRIVLDEATNGWGVRISRVELKTIDLPGDMRQAIEAQKKADAQKMAAIEQAEGAKQSAILNAQGEQQAAITRAEGERQARILQAEGEAQAIQRIATAKAQAVTAIYNAYLGLPDPSRGLALRYLETLDAMANGQATKIVVPQELSAWLSVLPLAQDLLRPSAGGGS